MEDFLQQFHYTTGRLLEYSLEIHHRGRAWFGFWNCFFSLSLYLLSFFSIRLTVDVSTDTSQITPYTHALGARIDINLIKLNRLVYMMSLQWMVWPNSVERHPYTKQWKTTENEAKKNNPYSFHPPNKRKRHDAMLLRLAHCLPKMGGVVVVADIVNTAKRACLCGEGTNLTRGHTLWGCKHGDGDSKTHRHTQNVQKVEVLCSVRFLGLYVRIEWTGLAFFLFNIHP